MSFVLSRRALVTAAFVLFTTLRGTAADPASSSPVPADDAMDIDAMAARIPVYQDIYKQTRDEALAALKKSRPNDGSDPVLQTFVRSEVYLNVWGDYYGEDVARHAGVYLSHMVPKDPDPGSDPLIALHNQRLFFADRHPGNDESAQAVVNAADGMGGSDYPALMKLDAYGWEIAVLVKYKSMEHVATPTPILAQLPALVDKWRAVYGTLIAAKLPHPVLFNLASSLLSDGQDDLDTLNLEIAAIDRAFNESDAASPVKAGLDGDYFIDAAWNARGGGWANTVTDSGWQLMAQRLGQAETILTNAYTANPGEGEIARTMITVILGQQKSRDEMELWFGRAIKADPNDYGAYKSKEWYLQPRWYGSMGDIVTFGQECVATNNWAARIPLIFPIGVAEAAQEDSSVYQNPQLWDLLVKVYSEYLSKYPKAAKYRTNFAKHAFDGGHLDVAREQFKILGADYDRDVLDDTEHARIVAKLGP